MKPFVIITLCFCLWSCAGRRTSTQPTLANAIGNLQLLGYYEVPFDLPFKNTTVGGLSGIDYNAKDSLYYLISDDRSAKNAARFYTAKIITSPHGIDSVVFIEVTFLRQADGSTYPNNKQIPSKTPDPEAIRFNAKTQQLLWTSEGERIVKLNDTVLENPAITTINKKGEFKDTFSLPTHLRMTAANSGPRQNGVLEGLTFADNYKHVWVNVEEPLYEDGPKAMLTDTTAWIRFFKFNNKTKQPLVQYAYKLDAVAHAPHPADAFYVNGVPDILWMGRNRFLVMERSFSTGTLACTIKLFEAWTNDATDIKDYASLQQQPNFTPMRKRLLLNMDTLGRYIDNVEGMTFGPILPNGHKTLVLVSDNNFSPAEKTQFFLFEIMP